MSDQKIQATGVRCGNHGGERVYHADRHEVRACYMGRTGDQPPADSVYRQAENVRRGEAHAWIHEGEKPNTILGRLRSQNARNDANRPVSSPPVQHPAPAPWGRPGYATLPQVEHIERLMAGKSEDAYWVREAKRGIENFSLNKIYASKVIDGLKATPRGISASKDFIPESEKPQPTVTQDGIYINRTTGEIFKVQYNRASGDGRRLYAKQLVLHRGNDTITAKILDRSADFAKQSDHSWSYKPGLLAKIRPEWRMTLAEAEQYGALYGRCMRCHRALTAEESIERAMGPVCAGKSNWA
jgi:hypothetical protein